jgi:hypothetical protein
MESVHGPVAGTVSTKTLVPWRYRRTTWTGIMLQAYLVRQGMG